MIIDDRNKKPGSVARRLMRTTRQVSLATIDSASEGRPYASISLVACGHDAAPLLLLPAFAQHSINIRGDNRISILFYKARDAITQGRVSIIGKAIPTEDHLLKKRFLSRHSSSQIYQQFNESVLYRVSLESVNFVLGDDQVHKLEMLEVIFNATDYEKLSIDEPEFIEDINLNFSELINLCANNAVGRPGMDWRLTGIDPEGVDLARNDAEARFDFDKPVNSKDSLMSELFKAIQTDGGKE